MFIDVLPFLCCCVIVTLKHQLLFSAFSEIHAQKDIGVYNTQETKQLFPWEREGREMLSYPEGFLLSIVHRLCATKKEMDVLDLLENILRVFNLLYEKVAF